MRFLIISRGTGFVPKCFGKKLFTGIMSQRELKQICDIMNNSVTDWIMSDGAMHFGVYGKQRGWVRAGFSQGIPDKADSDGFMAVPKQLELEIPFK